MESMRRGPQLIQYKIGTRENKMAHQADLNLITTFVNSLIFDREDSMDDRVLGNFLNI